MEFSYVAVAVFFGIWFLLSAINQLDYPQVRRLRTYDKFHVLPIWTFFAPNPGIYDYHLVVRTSESAWRQLPLLDERRWWHSIWNPRKRLNKIVSDIVMTVSIPNGENIDAARWNLISQSFPLQIGYLMLLNRAQASIASPPDGSLFRFALIRTHGFGEERTRDAIVVSRWHTLEKVSNDLV